MSVDNEIARLSALRSELWSLGDPQREVPGITEKLTALYAERRQLEAQDQHGDPALILRRARIESELERLMSD